MSVANFCLILQVGRDPRPVMHEAYNLFKDRGNPEKELDEYDSFYSSNLENTGSQFPLSLCLMDFEGLPFEGFYSNGFIDFNHFESPFDVLAGYPMSYQIESMVTSESFSKINMGSSSMVQYEVQPGLISYKATMDELSSITGNNTSPTAADEHEVGHEVWNYEDECLVPSCDFGDLSELLEEPALVPENHTCEEEDVGFLFNQLGFGVDEENERLDIMEAMKGWDEMPTAFMDECEIENGGLMKKEMDLVEMITTQHSEKLS
ncbi:hypothetical protein J5N97_009645 [Dioscorea zingiberensis]|uniref:Uncharacterized protein n=1 Tax=Dioscorea zingiberensis TaxID=325984 RepID=A0A9D5HLP0_9LILI|nr:hypothetical protein J5N97_009645 [Dioscorea zingiberensis]